jgi:Domain of unknown function (DUF4082)/PEP-CTERM motif
MRFLALAQPVQKDRCHQPQLRKQSMKFLAQLSIAALALTGLCNQAQAAAINLTTPGGAYQGGTYTLGFEFTVSQNMAVTSLGVYDHDKNGLASSSRVGLWDTSGNLLASTTVGAGTAGELDGYFRYNSINPFNLTAGVNYVVGAYLNDMAASLFTAQGGSGAFDPLVTVVKDRYAGASALTFASTSNGHQGAWLGANFRFNESATVPEPSTLLLVGLSLAGLSLLTRRKA